MAAAAVAVVEATTRMDAAVEEGGEADASVLILSSESEDDQDYDESSDSCSDSSSGASDSDSEGGQSDAASSVVIPNGEPCDDEDYYDYDDDEWDVINLADDEDDEEDSGFEERRMKKRDPKKKMVCMKCPPTKKGVFKDAKKFFFHLKRHRIQGMFNCPTCRHPFTKISYCVSHEIRVHGLEYEFDDKDKDPVIMYAKEYVKKKKERVIDLEGEEEDVGQETDPEDVKFYEDRAICSNSLMRYQGPEVDHWVQCYEIQLYQAGKKYKKSNGIAKLVIAKHRSNAELSKDVFRLGKYPWSKEKPPTILQKLPSQMEMEEEESERKIATPRRTFPSTGGPVGPSSKKTKKRKVIWMDISSTSSSSSEGEDTTDTTAKDNSSEDSPKKPKKKKRRLGIEGGSQVEREKLPEPKKTKVNTIPKRRTGGWGNPLLQQTKKKLPALITRVCMKCSYNWKTEDDLRVHRNAMHPTVPLIDLMAVTDPSGSDSKIKPPPLAMKKTKTKSKSIKSVAEEIRDRVNNVLSDDIFTAVIKKAKKKRKKTEKVQQPKPQPKSPSMALFTSPPGKTFTRKEEFLHSLGVVSTVRVQLKEKKPMDELNLKRCSVLVKRLTPEEILKHTHPSLFNFSHFLLG